MDKVTIGRTESHYGAILVKAVGLSGCLYHHWFDHVNSDTLKYTGYNMYRENTKTGNLERVNSKQLDVPSPQATAYAEKCGYTVVR